MKDNLISEYRIRSRKTGRRITSSGESISKSSQGATVALKLYQDDIGIYESCWAMFLNRANIPVGFLKVGQGGTVQCSCDTKIVVKSALDLMASGIILIHNHPSGSSIPGDSDRKMTRSVKEALKMFEIDLVDHIILCRNEYYSFTDGSTSPMPKIK